MKLLDKVVLGLVVVAVIAVIASTSWLLFHQKNYEFYVEASCDPQSEICFVRDCSVPDDCPPNQFETYRVFYVSAADFPTCTDNSCKNECLSETLQCTEQVCGESEEDECAEVIEVEVVEGESSEAEEDETSY